MNITEIVAELHRRGIVPSHLSEVRALQGGTASSVFVILGKNKPIYIIKLNDSLTIKNETQFLDSYNKMKLLPQVLYVDDSYRYFVYEYKAGTTQYQRGHKLEHLLALVEMINQYQLYDQLAGYGYLQELKTSWQQFMVERIEDSQGIIQEKLSEQDHQWVRSLAEQVQDGQRRYLLHGDCGVHNFLFTEERLTGVIDPIPVAGKPIFDLVYAFCSSPNDLSVEVFERSVSKLKPELVNTAELYTEVILGLYSRIATCLIHHPHDLDEYLGAWSYWKHRVRD